MAQAFIHGGYTDFPKLDRMSIVDPSSGEEVDTVPSSGEAEVDQAVRSACEAFPAWHDTPAAKRGEILGEAAEAVLAASEELAPLLTSEQGKPLCGTRSATAWTRGRRNRRPGPRSSASACRSG